jgi:hypothetical protein
MKGSQTLAFTLCATVVIAFLSLPALLDPIAAANEEAAPPPKIMHNVYFSLNDASMAAKQSLLDACQKYLAAQPGVLFFGYGTLADLTGPLNDRDYDVGLHITFESKADLEKYEVSDAHKQFVEENKGNWKKVRVFDSEVKVTPIQPK